MKKSVAILIFILSSLSLYGQLPVSKITEYIKNINSFNVLNPQEKVYLHFDNTGYYLGETIWFKAYIVFAGNMHPASLSKILHVELLNSHGEIVDIRKLKIENGKCHGEFELDKNKYCSDFYEVRAYTRSMLNYGEDCVFSRVFPVYEEPEKEGDYTEKRLDDTDYANNQRKKKEKQKKVNLSFYPEGGNSIIGLPSKVAFRARGESGEDIAVEGLVKNKANEVVSSFTSQHQGMGVFELIPQDTEYAVEVIHKGRKYDFTFSGIVSSGYSLRVNNIDEDKLLISVHKSSLLPYDTVAVSVSCRGRVVACEAFGAGNNPYILGLSKSKLPAGCLLVTVFDRQGTVYAERLVFNTLLQYGTIQVKQEKPYYRPFEKVEMELIALSSDGLPEETEFSLSVRDAGTELHTSYQDNILTNLLLSSDVRGYIDKPMQYFNNSDHSTRSKLDLLMMVQGWRRYRWRRMARLEPFVVGHYVEEGIPINGKVTSLSDKKGKAGVDIMFWMSQGKYSYHGKSKTDDNGDFYFLLPDSLSITGKWLLGLQASEKGKRKHYRIMLDRVFRPQGRAYTFYDTNVKDTLIVFEGDSAYPSRRSIEEEQVLEEVVVTSRKRKQPKDVVFNVESYVDRCIDSGESYPYRVHEYLEEVVPSYRFESAIKELQGINKTTGSRMYKDGGAVTLGRVKGKEGWVTGDNYSEYEYLRPLEEVEKIVFIRREEVLNEFYTSKLPIRAVFKIYPFKEEQRNRYQKGIRYTRFDGYSQIKEFYHADNSDKILGEVDFRRTLYWNPDIKTDHRGRVIISFYNNGTCRGMSVSAEGLTTNGIPVICEIK